VAYKDHLQWEKKSKFSCDWLVPSDLTVLPSTTRMSDLKETS